MGPCPHIISKREREQAKAYYIDGGSIDLDGIIHLMKNWEV